MSASVKLLLRQLLKSEKPQSVMWLDKVEPRLREGIARGVISENRDLLINLNAPPLAFAELEFFAGNFTASKSWAERQLMSDSQDLTEAAQTLLAWIALRRRQSNPGLTVPLWIIEFEEALSQINKGLVLQAFSRLQRMIPHAAHRGIAAWNGTVSALIFCLLHQGYFDHARICAGWHRKLLGGEASLSIEAMCSRRLATIAFFGLVHPPARFCQNTKFQVLYV